MWFLTLRGHHAVARLIEPTRESAGQPPTREFVNPSAPIHVHEHLGCRVRHGRIVTRGVP